MRIKATPYLKPLFCLVSIAIFMSAVSTPEKTGKKIFKHIQKDKIHKIEKYYLDKEEFIEFIGTMDPKPPQEQLDKIVSEYDDAKAQHLQTFDNLEVKDLKNVKIDRIEYDYQIAKKGKDEKIEWPKSKTISPTNSPTEQVKTNLTIYLEGNGKEYTMKLELMNYKGKWKILHLLRPCTIYEAM